MFLVFGLCLLAFPGIRSVLKVFGLPYVFSVLQRFLFFFFKATKILLQV